MTRTMKIAIIDDERDMRQSISQWLSLSGFETETFAEAGEALNALSPDYPGIVITDIRMPGMDGMQFLRRLMSIDSGLPVIMITGHGDVAMAVEAMQTGAFDFLEKPFDPDKMTELVARAAHRRRLTLDSRALRRDLSGSASIMERLIGASPEIKRLREDILDIGQADGHVLIEGETGTGKSLVSHALHAVGPRAGRAFALLSCTAHEEDALLRALFGPRRRGRSVPVAEKARGGTLVLEDIETLGMAAQARLLNYIDAQGAVVPAETRIIAVSNLQEPGRRLKDMLRPDLYYRLSAMRITIPPLRNRGEDILMLFARMAARFAEEYGCEAPAMSAEEAARMMRAPWPGNVRQLMHVAEQAVLQKRRGAGTISSLLIGDRDDTAGVVATGGGGKPLKAHVEAFERMLIDSTMQRHRGSIARVMEELRLPRRTLNEKMAKYGLHRADYL